MNRLALGILVLGLAIAAGTLLSKPGDKKHKQDTVAACDDCIDMVEIPAWTFSMGKDEGGSNRPAHRVSVPRFEIGKTEVTWRQWVAIMGEDSKASEGVKRCGLDCPAEHIHWDDAQWFIRRLNAKSGKNYRLPSEAEWEYACKAGSDSLYCGADLDSIAWHSGNSGSSAHPVGSKLPNAFGLHDMTGNVYEWVEDCWNRSYDGAPTDGSAWKTGECRQRVLRGGSWQTGNLRMNLGANYRMTDLARASGGPFGFRLAHNVSD